MQEHVKDGLKALSLIIMVIIITHALFFMTYGYIAGGDAFIALRNFYNLMYGFR